MHEDTRSADMEQAMAEDYKAQHGHYPVYPTGDDKPVEYPEGFKVLGVEIKKGVNEYKQVHLEDEKGKQHTALCFQSNPQYENLVVGKYNDKIVIKQNRKGYTVDNYTAWRNYKTLPEPTTFYFGDGQSVKNF